MRASSWLLGRANPDETHRDKFAAYIPEWSIAPPHGADRKTEIGKSVAAQKDPWATIGKANALPLQ